MEKITRFMEVMFSNTDEELAAQVDRDIKEAQEKGSFEDEDVKYEKTANGDVAITDKANGEVTLAQRSADEADTYDLIAVPDEQLEKFVHPSADGVTPGNQVGTPDEKKEDHVGPIVEPETAEEIAKKGPTSEECPECGEKECKCEGEKEFSVTSDNLAVQKIFSMPQEFVEYLFSEVIDSAETSIVGDIKIEKCAEDDNSVIVTSEATGDQAKVTLDDENMEVTELDSKNFSEESQFLPMFVIGVQPYDHFIVEAQEYDAESAEQLKAQLEEDGIESVQIFDTQEAARDYAMGLLEALGADSDTVEEPAEEREYSDTVGVPVWTVGYQTSDSVFMSRLFSEQACGIANTRSEVEKAISSGEPVQLEDGTIVTPLDAQNALIEDGIETTIATICGEDLQLEKVDAEEAEAVKNDGEIMEYEAQHEFTHCSEDETRLFSENEPFTNYMQRLFSEEADQNQIEDAIANGQELETETEIITPINNKAAVVEDKGNGEFTKVTLIDEETMNVHPISDDEAENLMENLKVGEDQVEEGEEEKTYSFCNEEQTRFFSLGETFTSYMQRLFSEEADQNQIEDAIQSGEQIENDTEIITPVDANTAIVEDKENGEFTKATIKNDDELDVHAISEDEADKLTENIKVEKTEEDKDDENKEEKKEEKEFSVLNKFFAEVGVTGAPVAQAVPVAQAPAVPVEGAAPVEEVPVAQESAPTVEQIEDKALAAIQSIKAAVEEGTAQIMEAKANPAPTAEPTIQEAQFSEKTFSQNDTLFSWLNNK